MNTVVVGVGLKHCQFTPNFDSVNASLTIEFNYRSLFYFFSNYIVLITACNKKQKYKNTKYESLHNKKGIELKSVLCQTILNCYSIVTSSIQRYAGVLSPYIGSTSDPSKLNFTLCTSATLISQYVHVVTGDTVGLSYR